MIQHESVPSVFGSVVSAPQSSVSSVIDPLGLLRIFVGILLGGLEYEYQLTPMPNWKSMEGRKTF